jgi:hypothetical protein
MRAGAYDRSAAPDLATNQRQPCAAPIFAQEYLTWKHRNTALSGQNNPSINGVLRISNL